MVRRIGAEIRSKRQVLHGTAGLSFVSITQVGDLGRNEIALEPLGAVRIEE